MVDSDNPKENKTTFDGHDFPEYTFEHGGNNGIIPLLRC